MPLFIVILLDIAVLYFFFGSQIRRYLMPRRHRLRFQIAEYKRHFTGRLERDRDILPPAEISALQNALDSLQTALSANDITTLEQCLRKCRAGSFRGLPQPKFCAILREYTEVLVVALGIAFAIRALFLQPFKIPTGSMQPTFYGIHFNQTETEPASSLLVRFFNYWNFSQSSVNVVAVSDGTLALDSIRPASGDSWLLPKTQFSIGRSVYTFPATPQQTKSMLEQTLFMRLLNGPLHVIKGDLLFFYRDYTGDFRPVIAPTSGVLDWSAATCSMDEKGRPKTTLVIDNTSLSIDLPLEDIRRITAIYATRPDGPAWHFKKGDRVIQGYAESGDHLFVNNLALIFMEPRRGMPMVFKTTDLVSDDGNSFGGSYYIKRLVGLPGDTLRIRDRKLYVRPKGAADFMLLDSAVSPAFDRIYSCTGGYHGYTHMVPNQQFDIFPSKALYLKSNEDEYTVPDGHYFMMGDNSENSWDSRWFGPVPRHALVGPPAFVWWPFSRRWGRPDRVEPDSTILFTPPTYPVVQH